MKNTLRSSLLAALLLSACAAQSPGTAAGPIADAAAAKDSAADTQLAETTAESDVAGQPDETASVDTAGVDAAPVDTAAVDAAPTDVATKLPATKGLQPEPLALPAFAHVVDSSGAAVSDQDLLGHYTVLWFYPAAGTSG